MKGVMASSSCVLVMALLAACSSGGGGPGPQGDTMRVTGTVWYEIAGADPADEAAVTATCDIDGNGSVDQQERASTTVGADGSYALDAPAAAGKAVVLRFAAEGYAPQLRTLTVGGTAGEVRLDVVLPEARQLQCQGLVCTEESGAASISGVEIADGYVRVFNPVAEAAAFPGAFRDSAGKMLVSTVFASFDLRDADDQPIAQLPAGQTARISLRVPRDTWPTLQDLVPGDERVQVPMYYFDEASGQWRAEGSGWLAKADGSPLTEAELTAVRDGTFAGDVVAVAEVSHFSYWNVDWPQADATTVVVRVEPPPGQEPESLAGAVCHLIGENFTGTSPPVVVGEDGSLCFDVQRSEPAGEDLDGNGLAGETRRVLLSCIWKDDIYRFGPFEIGSQASGACPASGTDLGSQVLDEAHLVEAELCTVSGRVLIDGQPTSGASVLLDDELVTAEEADALCGGTCQNAAMTQADGGFNVTTAWATQLHLEGYLTESRPQSTVIWSARRQLASCPEGEIDLHLQVEFCQSNLPELSYQSGVIDWQPAVPLSTLSVQSLMGEVRWMVYSEEGFAPPVTYGQVPAAAEQVLPAGGAAPAAAQSGDMVVVVPLGGFMDVDGLRCNSAGYYQVP